MNLPPKKRGRPPGSKSKRSANLQDKIAKLLDQNFDEVEALLFSEKMSDKAKSEFIVELMQFVIPRQSATSLQMKMQALANGPQFDELFNTLVSQHEQILQQQMPVLALPASAPQETITPTETPIEDAIQETENSPGEDELSPRSNDRNEDNYSIW